MATGEGLFQSFYEVVRLIPCGKVANYGQVANLARHRGCARFVGYALHANPEPGQDQGAIPCHRVVFKDGSICTGFAFGGPEVQRHLLQSEGVTFADSTHVDMAACQWRVFEPEELEALRALGEEEC